MAETIKCFSPVDGKLYASRNVASKKEIAAAFSAAHAAQQKWRRVPLAERAAYCSAAVDAMLAMKDEIVPELAWQMGRPIRYGAGELRGFEERARHMIGIAGAALANHVPAAKEGFTRFISREPLGRGVHHRAVELSLSHGGQLHHSGPDGRQCGGAETCRRRPCWWPSASRRPSTRPSCRKGFSSIS